VKSANLGVEFKIAVLRKFNELEEKYREWFNTIKRETQQTELNQKNQTEAVQQNEKLWLRASIAEYSKKNKEIAS
jgi:phage regulator Rha-like protein